MKVKRKGEKSSMRMGKKQALEQMKTCIRYLGDYCYCHKPFTKLINEEFEDVDFDGTPKIFGSFITRCDTNECDFHLTINYEIKVAEGDIPLDGLQTVIYELS